MPNRKKILWLPSWYPNKYDLFDGDFIQRHARAAALLHHVHVLFIKQAFAQTVTEETISENGNLTEQIIYLPKKKGLPGKLQNFKAWQGLYKKRITAFVENERPSAVHVHVPWKVGLIALWAKRKFSLPYLVTEHWGIYNKVVDDNIYTKPFFFRRLAKRIYREAAAFVSVSRYTGEGVNQSLLKKDFTVIPNVVDTALFRPAAGKYERFTFVHVSNAVPLKNIGGILEAFTAFLSQTKADARLVVVGNKDDKYKVLAQTLNLSDGDVLFKGELPYAEVAREVKRCHAFVLNSNIENSPCVIGEALCCGLPVIATAVGGVPELLNEENSILIASQNAGALAQAMKEMFEHYARFNAALLSSAAKKKFGLQAIASAFADLYQGY